MKKIIITAVGVLLMSTTAIYAQQRDTSGYQSAPSSPTPPAQPTPPARIQDQYREPDRVIVPIEQLPSTMRQTLQEPQYKGWEHSSIYQDRATGDYTLDIKSGNETPKTYRFDKSGRLMEDPDKPDQQGIDNQ